MDHAETPPPPGELTWDVVDAMEEILDHWESEHSPLDDVGLHKYILARTGLNHLRSKLPPREE